MHYSKRESKRSQNYLLDYGLSYVKAHTSSVLAWSFFAGFVILVYLYLSDREFSFLLTLSSLISCFCFAMVAAKIYKNKSFKGVSRIMFESYLLIHVFRMFSIVPYQGYLPYDKTGDWFYQFCEGVSSLLAGLIVYWGRTKYQSTYNSQKDKVPLLLLVVPAFIIAMIIHPSLNGFWLSDVSWTFALYLEIVAALPQLILFQQEKQVEPFTSHFLAGQVLVKLLTFIFWFKTFRELNSSSSGPQSFSGICVIVGQALQLLLFADFIFVYLKCQSQGVPMNLYYQDNV